LSESDTIVVQIDDSQLAELEMRLQLLAMTGEQVTGSRDLSTSLPGVNRNMRIILGQIPGMRQAIQYYFRLRWLERGVKDVERIGGISGYGNLALIILATTIILFEQAMRIMRDVERTQKEYELKIRKERGWSRAEFEIGVKNWEEYLRGEPP